MVDVFSAILSILCAFEVTEVPIVVIVLYFLLIELTTLVSVYLKIYNQIDVELRHMEIQKTELFQNWFGSLNDRKAKARIQIRIDRAELGNFGDHKAVGGGVSEMRVDYGPGYRIYYTLRGTQLVILLAGGDKTSQTQDIKIAQQLSHQL